jgi:FkbM family methyltransferase
MHFNSISGKLLQLRQAAFGLWPEFMKGWLNRRKTNTVPCLFPGCNQLVYVPLRDYYESHAFFCENPNGRRELKYFVDRLRSDDVFFDVGGYRGAFSAAAKAKLGNSISVHVFEPVRRNIEGLRALLAANHFSRLQINPLAVGDGRPVVGAVNEGDLVLRLGETTESGESQFESISIDEYVAAGNPMPSILKIDVDGFELRVLAGARNCLEKRHPRLWLEVHPTFLKNQGRSADDVLSLLKEVGYRPVFFDDYSKENRSAYHLWCE